MQQFGDCVLYTQNSKIIIRHIPSGYLLGWDMAGDMDIFDETLKAITVMAGPVCGYIDEAWANWQAGPFATNPSFTRHFLKELDGSIKSQIKSAMNFLSQEFKNESQD